MGIRLEVTTHPQFSTEELAIQLAEAMHRGINARRDADTFANQMQIENRKISELQFLVRKVEDFNRNPPEHVSRMEPLASYDIESLKKEIDEAKELRAEWANKQSEALKVVQDSKAEEARLQRELAERRSSKK